MTSREAIKVLDSAGVIINKGDPHKVREALMTAVDALKREASRDDKTQN